MTSSPPTEDQEDIVRSRNRNNELVIAYDSRTSLFDSKEEGFDKFDSINVSVMEDAKRNKNLN